MLTICYIFAAFYYDFRLPPIYMQEVTFYSVKGHLLESEKPSIVGLKDTV